MTAFLILGRVKDGGRGRSGRCKGLKGRSENEGMKTGQNGAAYKNEQTHATPAEARVASGDAFGFYERLRPASQGRKGIVTNGVAKNGNQRMRCEVGELSGRAVRSRNQGEENCLERTRRTV